MQKHTYSFIVIWVLAGIVAILDFLWVVAFPVGIFSVSAFYFWSAFFAAFAVWFRWKWILAIYLGLVIAALFSGFHVFVPLGALGNTLGAVLVYLGFRYLRLNPSLKSVKDYLGYILLVTLGSNIVSAVWTINILHFAGLIPADAINTAMYGWIIGGIVVSIVIGLPLFKWLTPVIRRLSITK